MNPSHHTLAAVRSGQDDDATVSATLDALREECNLTLMESVLAVFDAWDRSHAAAELVAVTRLYTRDKQFKGEVTVLLVTQYPSLEGEPFTLVMVAGVARPRYHTPRHGQAGYIPTVTVGASWVAAYSYHRDGLTARPQWLLSQILSPNGEPPHGSIVQRHPLDRPPAGG